MTEEKTKTVAVFDDDRTICTMIEKLVKKRGLVCVTADTIPGAAITMGQSDPDIVISDYEFEHNFNISYLAPFLKKVEKVLILTAGDPDEIKARYPELSFATFFKKGKQPITDVLACI